MILLLYYFCNISVGSSILIFIETRTGKITLEVKTYDTVKFVKGIIAVKERISGCNQHLFFAGKELWNPVALSAYNICNKSTLRLVQEHLIGQRTLIS